MFALAFTAEAAGLNYKTAFSNHRNSSFFQCIMSSNCSVQQSWIYNSEVQMVFYVLYIIIAVFGITGNLAMIVLTSR